MAVTFVHYIQASKDIVKLLCRPGSAIILVLLTNGAGTQFQGNPFRRDAKYKGWEYFAIFHRNPRVSQERYEICYGTLIGSNMRSVE